MEVGDPGGSRPAPTGVLAVRLGSGGTAEPGDAAQGDAARGGAPGVGVRQSWPLAERDL